jgi:hypothetical protein
MENLKEQIDKKGYVVVPNVFSSEELDDIAIRVESSAKKIFRLAWPMMKVILSKF